MSLPIDAALPELLAALAGPGAAVLQAPPGAGKTTGVPLALLDQPWRGDGKIIVVEPRRLAARAAARRMAQMLGQAVGETVGYRVRLDTKISAATRIEVVTDGLFLRRLQNDPGLDGVAAVLFDEVHERGVDGDLALALCLEARDALRDDLRLVAMSATLDADPFVRLMEKATGGAVPLVSSAGRAFPVTPRHLDAPPPGGRIEPAVVDAVRSALREETGSILVFLPGVGEIRRTESLLRDGGLPADVILAPLYGDLTAGAQDQAVAPAPPGVRKIVLATPIAETSLTIEGVRVVIDSGLARAPRFDPASGMSRLATVKISQASSTQRMGRAGRLEPGVCYRLWPEPAQRGMAPFTPPEILGADLAPLALELAAWGAGDGSGLPWLDPPPAHNMAEARRLLTGLGALNEAGDVTPHGRAMAGLGVHPRLAHMMLRGKELGLGALACLTAALLSERDVVRAERGFRDADLRLRVDLLLDLAGGAKPRAGRGLVLDRGGAQTALQQAKAWRRQLGVPADADATPPDGTAVGRLVALAYPDRIAVRRPGAPPPGVAAQYRMTGGKGATFIEFEPLAAEDRLAAADLDGAARDARIFLAAPIDAADIEALYGSHIRTQTVVEWDGRGETVRAERRRVLFELTLETEKLNTPPPELTAAAMLKGVRDMGLSCLPWTDGLRAWRERVAFLRRVEGEEWPDVSDEALLSSADEWLLPHLSGMTRRAHLERLDLNNAVRALLPWPLPQRLDVEAPTHVEVPSGSRVPVDYAVEEPVLAVRLQEMFGLAETPRVAGGRVPLLLHLLSPARRPLQVTRDLAGFWAGSYKQVKAEMKGQYPKHYWPDDPMQAEPTARAKPRR
jgi:ATP-dependent helicase HrpB